MNAQKQPGDVLSHKTRSWDNLRLGDLVKAIATDNGLIPKVAGELADIHIEHLDQVAESDANLLSRCAHLQAVRRLLAVSGAGSDEHGFGKNTGRITVVPEEVSRWSYSEGQRGSSTGDSKTGKGKIGVRYFDEADGRTKTTSVEHDGPSIANPYTQSAKATADQQAKSRKTQAKRNERKMTLSGPCRPKHVPLTAESGVTTAGFGAREDRSRWWNHWSFH